MYFDCNKCDIYFIFKGRNYKLQYETKLTRFYQE